MEKKSWKKDGEKNHRKGVKNQGKILEKQPKNEETIVKNGQKWGKF